MTALSLLGWLLLALAAVGAVYMVVAGVFFGRLTAPGVAPTLSTTAVTILKPLYGPESRLAENLATFLAQDHHGPIQLLCGVGSVDDPAIRAVEALRRAHPQAMIDLVVDPTRHGSNAKMGNLVNMMAIARHDVLILSDSDMAVPPDYLSRVLAALDAPGVGAVTCLYCGRGDAGFWSRIAATGPSWQFLAGLSVGIAGGLAQPCMGSTIALRRETLAMIGGFAAFADILADDHAIGQAVAALGFRVAVPPLLLTHAHDDSSLRAVWRHELRWAATVRSVAPAGYAGSIVTYPLPIALLGTAFHPIAGLGIALAALATRLAFAGRVDARAGVPTAPLWLLPARDFLSFAVFLVSFFVASVDWRGTTLRMAPRGTITADPENSP